MCVLHLVIFRVEGVVLGFRVLFVFRVSRIWGVQGLGFFGLCF